MLMVLKDYCRTYSVSTLKNIIKIFGQLLCPLKCLKCGVYIDPDMVKPHTMEACFCDHCMGLGIYPIDTPYCIKCGIQFQKITAPGSEDNHVCENCLKAPLKLDRVRAAVKYKGIAKEAIPLFKYHSKLSLAKVFEHLLFQTFLRHYSRSRIDLIMPVPLHKAKLRERGFNQAFMMIRNFNKTYKKTYQKTPLWEIDTISLARVKKTKPQTGFDIKQRENNLKKAFEVVDQKKIENQNILLIDDVYTTGATCNEAAVELLRNGAKKVEALVLART